jgi:hypothetical protein
MPRIALTGRICNLKMCQARHGTLEDVEEDTGIGRTQGEALKLISVQASKQLSTVVNVESVALTAQIKRYKRGQLITSVQGHL